MNTPSRHLVIVRGAGRSLRYLATIELTRSGVDFLMGVRWKRPFSDRFWNLELEEFATTLAEQRCPIGNIHDAGSTMPIIEQISRNGVS